MTRTVTVDVAEFLDRQKIGPFHFRVGALCALTLILDGIDNQSLAYVAPALTQAWHLGRGALGPVFTAGFVGTALGTLITGPLTDRFGRKPMLIGTVLWFSLLNIAISQTTNLTELAALRFLTGLGFGSMVPMAIVMTGEYAPRRSRAAMVTITCCGFDAGAGACATMAAQLIPHYGWNSVFLVSGILPLFFLVPLWLWLPESARFLALRPGDAPRLASVLRRVDPKLVLPGNVRFVVAQEIRSSRLRPLQLFAEGRSMVTIVLWALLACNTTVLGLLNSWLPTLVTATGLPRPEALRVASALQFGGIIGTVSLGFLADRFSFYRVLTVSFLTGGVFIGLVGSAGAVVYLLVPIIAVIGFCTTGSLLSSSTLATTFYPTNIRSTGLNWAHGVSRMLASVGPMIAGTLIAANWPLPHLFLLISVPLFLASGCIVILGTIRGGWKKVQRDPAVTQPSLVRSEGAASLDEQEGEPGTASTH